MKIFIEDNAIGHVVTSRMMPVWQKGGHGVRRKAKGSEVQLSFVRIQDKKSKIPKVLRIDGVYYDLDSAYKGRNEAIGSSHARADGVIYQSKYAEVMSARYLKPARKPGSLSTIIYNGISKNWCGEHAEHEGFNIVVSAKWRRHKRLAETIDVFLRCLHAMPDAVLHVFGMLYDNKKVKHPNIKYYGMVNRKSRMKGVFVYSDLSIHLSKKDCCPNSVVEAIGAGIPVITTNACGGAAEMCRMTPGCLVCESDDESYEPCHPYRDGYNKMRKTVKKELIELILQVYEDRRRVQQPKRLGIGYMAKHYVSFMKQVSEKTMS